MGKVCQPAKSKAACCGCAACEHICERHAIRMEADEEGFLYPITDMAACISCDKCREVCPFEHADDICIHVNQKFAAKYLDDKIRMASTSGAAYTVFSDFVLERNGIVYGSIFDSEWNVRYARITDKAQRDLSRGAKYVQSSLDDTFRQVQEDLVDGRLVMFVGPPCYTAGMKRYIELSHKTTSGTLIVVDMVCHGVPSLLIWKDNVAFLNEQYPGNWESYTFRDKTCGWRGAHNTLTLDDEKIKDTKALNAYTSLYFAGYISRPACHQCEYAALNRPGDITIGDCWGIEQSHPDFDDGKGVSLIMINSKRGASLFEEISQQFSLLELNADECLQPQLHEPSKPSGRREEFWKLYWEKGYIACIKKYTSYGKSGSLRHKVGKMLKKQRRGNCYEAD